MFQVISKKTKAYILYIVYSNEINLLNLIFQLLISHIVYASRRSFAAFSRKALWSRKRREEIRNRKTFCAFRIYLPKAGELFAQPGLRPVPVRQTTTINYARVFSAAAASVGSLFRENRNREIRVRGMRYCSRSNNTALRNIFTYIIQWM